MNRQQLKVLREIKAIEGTKGKDPQRNNLGPVGVYKRNTSDVMAGYESLKYWEKQSGKSCRLVITVGAYKNIAEFVRIANDVNKENWLISAVSFTGADSLSDAIRVFGQPERIIMTQVVPLLDADLPIVKEARNALGSKFGFVSLEGYIVGKLTLAILKATPTPLSRQGFMEQVAKTKLSIGGVPIDYTKHPLQGSDLVITSFLSHSGYQQMTADIWKQWLNGVKK